MTAIASGQFAKQVLFSSSCINVGRIDEYNRTKLLPGRDTLARRCRKQSRSVGHWSSALATNGVQWVGVVVPAFISQLLSHKTQKAITPTKQNQTKHEISHQCHCRALVGQSGPVPVLAGLSGPLPNIRRRQSVRVRLVAHLRVGQLQWRGRH
jgi:hypothetical protein